MSTRRIFNILLFIFSLLVLIGCDEVPSYEKDDHQKILDLINIGFASGDSLESVTKNLNLPNEINTNIFYDEIAWTSSSPSVIDSLGVVRRPEVNTSVTLAVTVTINNVGKEKLFYLLVLAADVSYPQEYVVSFDTNGGGTVNNQLISAGELAVKPASNPQKINYMFLGWYDKDGNLFDFNQPINDNVIVYAKWVPTSDGTSFTVVFDSDGGGLFESQIVKPGELAVKPINDPIKSNYEFLGWFDQNNLPFNFNQPINEDITIYAKWQPINHGVSYQVVFNTNGGSSISPINIGENNLIQEPQSPTRNGDQFVGWFKDSELNNPWNFNVDKVTNNLTLYAKWELADIPFINGRTLLFNDEFNGNSLNRNKWDFQNGTGREYGLWWWGNDEKQFYKEDNVEVSNGTLKIHAKIERTYDPLANATMDFSSAKIVTLGKYAQTYGRIEARLKAPIGDGFWPAFWMMPVNNTYGNGWPHNGEIDIVELRGRLPREVTSAFHFQGPNGHQYLHGAGNIPNNGRIDEFHVYAVEWSEGRLDFSVDDYVYHSRTSAWYQSPKPFNHDFYIILNLAIGGHFDGHKLPSPSDFPAKLEVDYVRAYA